MGEREKAVLHNLINVVRTSMVEAGGSTPLLLALCTYCLLLGKQGRWFDPEIPYLRACAKRGKRIAPKGVVEF